MPVHHRLRFLTFPMRGSRLCSLWPDMRPLRFRRAPFGRDGTFDRGGATASRIVMPHMLPSTVPSVSPPQNSIFRGSIPHPIRSLCTLRTRRRRRLRNTRFAAARYRLTGAGLSPAGSRQLRLTHRNRKFVDSLLEGDGFELLVPQHKSRGFPQHSGHCEGIGGARKRYHLMVQPLFFCAWNHSTEPEQGDLLSVFAHTGQREAKIRLVRRRRPRGMVRRMAAQSPLGHRHDTGAERGR
jgi:hypothetical protein